MLLFTTSVSAHVTVNPNQVGIGAFQTFNIGVPVEKDIPTTGLRLVIPEGLKEVTPNVKPGWTVNVKKEGEGDETKVTEISWTGGSIPAGQRDEFLFSAQAPAEETQLIWKVYQTYSDGTVVSWDADPGKLAGEEEESETSGPYSKTMVINDLKSDNQTKTPANPQNKDSNLPLILSILALILGVVAISRQLRKG